MDFDTLVAEAVKLKGAKKKAPRRSSRPTQGDAYRQTKEELRKLQLERCVPESVHLRLTDQECECGEHMQSVNTVPLVKCVGPTLTHFRGVNSFAEMAEYNDLPRVIEITKIHVPYCETCFANASVTVQAPQGPPDFEDFASLFESVVAGGDRVVED